MPRASVCRRVLRAWRRFVLHAWLPVAVRRQVLLLRPVHRRRGRRRAPLHVSRRLLLLLRLQASDRTWLYGTRGGSRGVTSHPPHGAAAYFMLLLCVWLNSQMLIFHSPISPDPLNARWLRSLRFPKSPPLKILDPPLGLLVRRVTGPKVCAFCGDCRGPGCHMCC